MTRSKVRRAPPPEGHVHTAVVVMEGGDGVVEEELDVLANRVVEGVGEVPAAYFEVTALDAAGDDLRLDGGHPAAVGGQEGDQAAVDVRHLAAFDDQPPSG